LSFCRETSKILAEHFGTVLIPAKALHTLFIRHGSRTERLRVTSVHYVRDTSSGCAFSFLIYIILFGVVVYIAWYSYAQDKRAREEVIRRFDEQYQQDLLERYNQKIRAEKLEKMKSELEAPLNKE